jgi:hypothetical protein
MGILDIFRRKRKNNNFPANELEKIFIEAASNMAARKKFYVKLLWNDLFVLTTEEQGTEEGSVILEKGSNVAFTTFDEGVIPIFTSTDRIFDKGIIKTQVRFLSMKGKDLFSLAKGATFILNPFSDYQKELLPQEIDALLDGTLLKENNKFVVDEDTNVLIGQPEKYPEELVKALSILFKNKPAVQSAYLGLIKFNNNDNPPHLIVGLKITCNIEEITNEAIPITEQFCEEHSIVDFIQINKECGVSDYFVNQTEPFYEN